VDFLLDGDKVASVLTPPFAYPWSVKTGSHQLLVRAYDQAGNMAEAEIEFVVEQK
jgi:hypothetical protein